MGRAYCCDRCGTYDDSPERRVREYRGGYGSIPGIALMEDYYLCELCADDFETSGFVATNPVRADASLYEASNVHGG